MDDQGDREKKEQKTPPKTRPHCIERVDNLLTDVSLGGFVDVAERGGLPDVIVG